MSFVFQVLEKPLCRAEVSSQRTVRGRQGSLRRAEGDGLLLHNPGLEQPLLWLFQLRGALWFHCALIGKLSVEWRWHCAVTPSNAYTINITLMLPLRSENNFWKWILSFYHLGPRDQTQVIRLVPSILLLSHPASPSTLALFIVLNSSTFGC